MNRTQHGNAKRVGWKLAVLALGVAMQLPVGAFHNPQVGRWLNRDPIAERAGANLFAFVENAPPRRVDLAGLCEPIVLTGGTFDVTRAGALVPPAAGCGNPCRGKLDFTVETPKAIDSLEEIKRLCGGAAACASADRASVTMTSECRECAKCKFRLVINIKARCVIYYADPAKISVKYEPNNIERVKSHEQCHCNDFWAAYEAMIQAHSDLKWHTRESCEETRKEFEGRFQRELDGRMAQSRDHTMPKYRKPDDPCYCTGELLE